MATVTSYEHPFILPIESPRLRYRTVQMSDLNSVVPIIARQETMQWTSRAPIFDRGEAATWLRDRAVGPGVFNFAILLKHQPSDVDDKQERVQQDKLIGLMGTLRCPEIGYMLHPDYFGQGYATEALHTLLPWLADRIFSTVDEHGCCHNHVEALTDSKNVASRRLLERLCFRLVVLRENDFMNPTLGLRDTAVYRYVRPNKAQCRREGQD